MDPDVCRSGRGTSEIREKPPFECPKPPPPQRETRTVSGTAGVKIAAATSPLATRIDIPRLGGSL